MYPSKVICHRLILVKNRSADLAINQSTNLWGLCVYNERDTAGSHHVDLKSAGCIVGGVDSAQRDLRTSVLPAGTTVTITPHRAACVTLQNFEHRRNIGRSQAAVDVDVACSKQTSSIDSDEARLR